MAEIPPQSGVRQDQEAGAQSCQRIYATGDANTLGRRKESIDCRLYPSICLLSPLPIDIVAFHVVVSAASWNRLQTHIFTIPHVMVINTDGSSIFGHAVQI